MSDAGAVWESGDAHGLVWEWGSALLPGELELDRVTKLWAGLAGGAHVGAFLKALSAATGEELLSLPDFAVAVMVGAGAHLAVRGRFAIAVEAGAELIRIDGSAVSTWSERRVGVAGGVELRAAGGAEGTRRPIREGVVPANVIRIGTFQTDDKVAASVAPATPVVLITPAEVAVEPSIAVASKPALEPRATALSVQEPVVEEPMVEQPGAEPAGAPSIEDVDQASALEQPDARPADLPGADAPSAESASVADGAADQAGSAAEPPLAQLPCSGSLNLPEHGEDDEPESLVRRAAPPRPTLSDEPVAANGRSLAGAWNEDSILDLVEQAAVRVEAEAAAPPVSGSMGLITTVPRATVEARSDAADHGGDVVSLAEGVLDFDDHDGYTIAAQVEEPLGDEVSALGADEASDVDPPAAATDPVRASFCPDEHPNPTHRSTCRVCGAGLGAGQTTIGRPSLGRLRGSSGEVLELTGPIIVGRTPRADRFRGAEVPQLLPVQHKHISANHLQICTEGWSVLAVDLNSRNGTYLRRRGQQPTRLLETPIPLASGDVLDLGHGVQLTFEDLP